MLLAAAHEAVVEGRRRRLAFKEAQERARQREWEAEAAEGARIALTASHLSHAAIRQALRDERAAQAAAAHRAELEDARNRVRGVPPYRPAPPKATRWHDVDNWTRQDFFEHIRQDQADKRSGRGLGHPPH